MRSRRRAVATATHGRALLRGHIMCHRKCLLPEALQLPGRPPRTNIELKLNLKFINQEGMRPLLTFPLANLLPRTRVHTAHAHCLACHSARIQRHRPRRRETVSRYQSRKAVAVGSSRRCLVESDRLRLPRNSRRLPGPAQKITKGARAGINAVRVHKRSPWRI